MYDVPNRITGIGNYARNVSRELRKLGVQVDVFSPRFAAPVVGPVFSYFRNIARKVGRYDVVHSNEAAGVFVPHRYIVESFHHQYLLTKQLRYSFFSRIEYLACKRARRVIVPSENSAKELCAWGGFSNKVSIIPHGVDSSIFRRDEKLREIYRSKLKISGFTAISVGRLERYKRHIDIVRALGQIPRSSLILVGSGGELRNVLDEAARRKVRLLYFDHVSPDDLVGLYNCADVYVHASVLEGFGLTTLEAMACGLPVVAYKTGDFDRMVGDAGMVLERRSPSAITDKLVCLTEDSSMLRTLRSKALVQSQKFTWEESAHRHIETYLKAIKEH